MCIINNGIDFNKFELCEKYRAETRKEMNISDDEIVKGIDKNPYLRAFLEDYSVRTSCYNCKFKTQKRVTDITIWD